MKRISIIVSIFSFFVFGIASNITATSYINFTNRTPLELNIKNIEQVGKDRLEDRDYEKLESSLKPGKSTNIFMVSRAGEGFKVGDEYEFKITIEIPPNTDASSGQPTGDPLDLIIRVKIHGVALGTTMEYSAEIDKIFETGFKPSTNQNNVDKRTFTRTGPADKNKTKTNEGFELRFEDTSLDQNIMYELIWYADDWKYEYPDLEGKGSAGTDIFEKVGDIIKGINATSENITKTINTWTKVVNKLTKTYIPEMKKEKAIDEKIDTIALMIPEFVDGLNKIQILIAELGYYLIQPFNEKAFKSTKDIVDGMANMITIVDSLNALLPEIAAAIKEIEKNI